MPGTNQATTAAGAGMTGMIGMHMQMERRMAMMEQMMQMMVDRESINPRK
jgi:tetrahydromethanopterin S-methyltransferase subunit D